MPAHPPADGGSLATLRELNRLRVVDALRRRGTASRSDLARQTGLSRTTVAAVVADLQARGLVIELRDEQVESDGAWPAAGAAAPGPVGGLRARHRLRPPPRPRRGRRPLVDGARRARRSRSTSTRAAPRALDAAAELIDVVLDEAGVDRDHVVGAGMGIPGPIDRATGRVGSSHDPAGLERRRRRRRAGAPARACRSRSTTTPTSARWARSTYGAGRGLADVVYVKLSVRHRRRPDPRRPPLPRRAPASPASSATCGASRRASSAAAATAAASRPSRPADGARSRSCGPRTAPELTVHGMLELVAAGDLGARRVVNDAGRAIGRVLADLCNHLNPAAIIVGGDLSAAGGPLLDGIRESIDRYAQPGAADAVEVKPGVLGERAEVLGALALVIGDTDRLAVGRTSRRANDTRRRGARRSRPAVHDRSSISASKEDHNMRKFSRGSARRSPCACWPALGAARRGSRPLATKPATADVCVLLPDTKTSVRWELFDRPYLAAAFKAAGVSAQHHQRAGRRAEAALAGRRLHRRTAPRSCCSTRLDPGSGAAITNAAVAGGAQGHRLRPARPRAQGRVLRLVRQRQGRQAAGPGPRRGAEGERQVRQAAGHRRAERRHHGQQRQAVQAGLRLGAEPAVQERHVQEGDRRRPVDRLGHQKGLTIFEQMLARNGNKIDGVARGQRRPRGRGRLGAEEPRPQADPGHGPGRDADGRAVHHLAAGRRAPSTSRSAPRPTPPRAPRSTLIKGKAVKTNGTVSGTKSDPR